MKQPPTIREEFFSKIVKQLQTDNKLFMERLKVMEKRLDFMQDETAKIAVEEQALIKGTTIIVKIANDLMDKQEKPKDVFPKDSTSQHIQ